jgi:hypothetical protein
MNPFVSAGDFSTFGVGYYPEVYLERITRVVKS